MKQNDYNKEDLEYLREHVLGLNEVLKVVKFSEKVTAVAPSFAYVNCKVDGVDAESYDIINAYSTTISDKFIMKSCKIDGEDIILTLKVEKDMEEMNVDFVSVLLRKAGVDNGI